MNKSKKSSPQPNQPPKKPKKKSPPQPTGCMVPDVVYQEVLKQLGKKEEQYRQVVEELGR